MKPLHPCQLTKEVEPFQVKHDNILTAKQAEFVNKELGTGNNTIFNKENHNTKHSRRDRIGQCLPKDINGRN